MSGFGEKLKLLREYRKQPQKQLAETMGTTIEMLSKYECGKLSNPTFETLKGFARALEITIDYFDSDYTPAEFFLRDELIDTADKLSVLPKEIRAHDKRIIQNDYDEFIKNRANEPVWKRRSSSKIVI